MHECNPPAATVTRGTLDVIGAGMATAGVDGGASLSAPLSAVLLAVASETFDPVAEAPLSAGLPSLFLDDV
jgi:hypothetical protein